MPDRFFFPADDLFAQVFLQTLFLPIYDKMEAGKKRKR